MIGGDNEHDEDDFLSSMECLDLQTGQWSEMTLMITPRYNHGVAVVGSKIFVGGGFPVSMAWLKALTQSQANEQLWTP